MVRVLLAIGAAMLSLGACRSRPKPAPASIRFPHAKHVGEADCGDCHGDVKKSTAVAGGKHIPGKKKCADCHEVKKQSECRKCHVGPMKGSHLVRGNLRKLRFSHAAHGKLDCKRCHDAKAERTKSSLASRPALVPGHATCNTAGCHQKQERRAQCQTCHTSLGQMGYKPLAAVRHGPGFARNHGTVAKQNIGVCTQCHDQPYCAKCHARTAPGKPSMIFPDRIASGFRHRGDFVNRHGIEARANPTSCAKCHGVRGCRACHALQGLSATVHASQPKSGSRTTHPAGWMTPGSSDFHGRAARRNIATCASCHDRGAASNCIKCHKVGGTGGNPHPPGFRWRQKSARCRAQTMCITCHIAGAGCP